MSLFSYIYSLNLFQIKYPAGIITQLMVIHFVIIRDFQPVRHQIRAAESFSFVIQRLVVYPVQLGHLINLIRMKPRHPDTRQMLVAEMLGLPPIEHSLLFFRCDIHQRSCSKPVIRRKQPVNISQLYHRTNPLVSH